MPSSPGARLVAGMNVAAPAGALAYCLRAPQECGGAPADGLRGAFAPVGASPRSRTQGSDASIFAAMMAARASALRAGPTRAEIGFARHEMVLTDARWNELRRIGRSINSRIIPTTDVAQYGVNEIWDRPLALQGRARGDCEDYALEKRAALIQAGWSADTLAMAVAMAPRIGLHAVLIAQTDRGDYVLDNFSNEPRPVDALDYVWLSRQVGPRLIDWAAASVSAPSSAHLLLAAAAPVESPESLFQRLMNARVQNWAQAERPAQHAQAETFQASLTPAPAAATLVIETPLAPIAPMALRVVEIAAPRGPDKRDTKAGASEMVLSERAKGVLLAPRFELLSAEEGA